MVVDNKNKTKQPLSFEVKQIGEKKVNGTKAIKFTWCWRIGDRARASVLAARANAACIALTSTDTLSERGGIIRVMRQKRENRTGEAANGRRTRRGWKPALRFLAFWCMQLRLGACERAQKQSERRHGRAQQAHLRSPRCQGTTHRPAGASRDSSSRRRRKRRPCRTDLRRRRRGTACRSAKDRSANRSPSCRRTRRLACTAPARRAFGTRCPPP